LQSFLLFELYARYVMSPSDAVDLEPPWTASYNEIGFYLVSSYCQHFFGWMRGIIFPPLVEGTGFPN